ncbi:TIGR02147 family protein [Bacteriovorax sp. Seq25_V]|uniref:TIGR02147 family protein n=1 Tax=Bacteriovorax sp. Seq25_V TaxID=1201288 RepID=UPI000389E89C|nr:TIGR02147 family protein [Bacteriovorax sp. Seq25_V]EQC43742.1 TIGR02147 family protein [Bacteriovorax sp. Seq25_V]
MKDFSSYLKSVLEERQKNKNNYSIRSFALDLGVGKTTIAEIINGSRVPSERNLQTIIGNITQSEEERELLINQYAEASLQKRLKFKILEEAEFHPISDWEYFAILNLCKLKGNQGNAKWISQQLFIKESRAEECLKDLIAYNYLTIRDGKLLRLTNPISSQTEVSDLKIKKHHSHSLNLAEEALYNTPVEVREYIAGTIAIEEADLAKAKDELFEFYRSFAKKYDKTENADLVYKINIQFFPCRNY